MPLERKTEPTDIELETIKKALEERLLRFVSSSDFTDYQSNDLAKSYYSVSGLDINENLLNAIVESYVVGFTRARYMYETPDDSLPF